MNAIQYLFELNTLDRVKFISIRNYTNASGETSNYTLIAAFDYAKAVAKDIARLKGVTYENPLKELARREMLNALENNRNEETRSNASQAQIDAYRQLGANSRVHKDTHCIMVWAFLRQKTVLVKGQYKSTNKQAKTIFKDQIAKELRLSTKNYRQFKLFNIKESVVNGETLTIS